MTMNTHALATLEWLAGIGAASAADIATVRGTSLRVTREALASLEQAGLVETMRVLHGSPALYVITRAGLRRVGRGELAPPRVSVAGFAHQQACARVAAALTVALAATHDVHSERELRAWERTAGAPLASPLLGIGAHGGPEYHRPDLVCVPRMSGSTIAVEVELTVKAPARLRRIIRAWARTRLLDAVVYYAPAGVRGALARAVNDEAAEDRVSIVAIERAGDLGSPSSIPSAA